MNKVIFPFFNEERHGFLLKKWWFRAIIVMGVIFLIIIPIVFFCAYHKQQYYNNSACNSASFLGVCRHYDARSLQHVKEYNYEWFYNEKVSVWVKGIGLSVVGTIVIYYFIQIIFFQIAINYIFLGESTGFCSGISKAVLNFKNFLTRDWALTVKDIKGRSIIDDNEEKTKNIVNSDSFTIMLLGFMMIPVVLLILFIKAASNQ